jgi:serine/threonine-protein kinase
MEAPLEPGTVVAFRYRIVSHLGSGGMAHVYRAEHMGLRRIVALKVLPPEAAGTIDGARFEREARAAARLQHRACVRVLDYGRWIDRSRFLAMELLEGATLRAVLAEQGALSTARAVRIAAELLRALAHAHRHGIFHRDVKPENIMFTTRDGASRPVLIDFGLARVADEGPLTAAGICIGSPSYLAPERLLGRPYDARADLYAVGVLLYEMLAGHRPFNGDSGREIALCALKQAPVPLHLLGVAISGPLWAVIARAMKKDPRERFADAEQMLSALEAVPVLERQQAIQRAAVQAEEEATAMVVTLEAPSAPRRVWSWLRFGRWRWREDAGAPGRIPVP